MTHPWELWPHLRRPAIQDVMLSRTDVPHYLDTIIDPLGNTTSHTLDGRGAAFSRNLNRSAFISVDQRFLLSC
jgi:hypothetical protein